jgi:ABC-type dipeptide/oligopeptide/nickel transport system permease component
LSAYLVRRLWQFVPTLLGVVLLVFILFNWVGGDPAYLLAGEPDVTRWAGTAIAALRAGEFQSILIPFFRHI